jgi:hypothetical protein
MKTMAIVKILADLFRHSHRDIHVSGRKSCGKLQTLSGAIKSALNSSRFDLAQGIGRGEFVECPRNSGCFYWDLQRICALQCLCGDSEFKIVSFRRVIVGNRFQPSVRLYNFSQLECLMDYHANRWYPIFLILKSGSFHCFLTALFYLMTFLSV